MAMKKFLLLLIFSVAATSATTAQAFLNRLPTVNTGIKGCINTDYCFLKVSGHDDLSHEIKNGSSFELLNFSTIKDDKSLSTLKIKITYDAGDGSNKDLVGYVYPVTTSISKYVNYTTNRVSIDFPNLIPTSYTGITGSVTYEGLTLRQKDFNDYSPNLSSGTKFELLSTTVARSIDCMDLALVKIKVTDGPHAGKVGYVYPSLTTLNGSIDYTNNVITAGGSTTPTPTQSYTADNMADYVTERTGISGVVEKTNDTLDYAYGFEDGEDWLDEVHVKAGTRFDLLNKKVYFEEDVYDYYIKVRVTYDPQGLYTNKIMWLTIYNTSLSSRFDETEAVPMVK